MNKQLLLTKATFKIIIKHLINDLDNHARENIQNYRRNYILYNVFDNK